MLLGGSAGHACCTKGGRESARSSRTGANPRVTAHPEKQFGKPVTECGAVSGHVAGMEVEGSLVEVVRWLMTFYFL